MDPSCPSLRAVIFSQSSGFTLNIIFSVSFISPQIAQMSYFHSTLILPVTVIVVLIIMCLKLYWLLIHKLHILFSAVALILHCREHSRSLVSTCSVALRENVVYFWYITTNVYSWLLFYFLNEFFRLELLSQKAQAFKSFCSIARFRSRTFEPIYMHVSICNSMYFVVLFTPLPITFLLNMIKNSVFNCTFYLHAFDLRI